MTDTAAVLEKERCPEWWRVVITPGALTKVNRARRRFRCEGHIADVAHFIEPGERYVRTSLPPDHPDINNDTWWHMRLCMACCPVGFTDVTPRADPDCGCGSLAEHQEVCEGREGWANQW